jgi:hypothetical protein
VARCGWGVRQAVMAYNFKRMLKLMGGAALKTALATL